LGLRGALHKQKYAAKFENINMRLLKKVVGNQNIVRVKAAARPRLRLVGRGQCAEVRRLKTEG
jgi:hypothetical protein